jgi:hypothetical protein
MKRFALVAALLLFGSAAGAAMSVTCSKSLLYAARDGNYWAYNFAVTSAADGTASGSTDQNNCAGGVHGWGIHGVTNPGSTAPSPDYDCTFLDTYGLDVFGGALGNRHTSDTERTFPLTQSGALYSPRLDGVYTLSCTNMGDSKVTAVTVVVME